MSTNLVFKIQNGKRTCSQGFLSMTDLVGEVLENSLFSFNFWQIVTYNTKSKRQKQNNTNKLERFT